MILTKLIRFKVRNVDINLIEFLWQGNPDL